LIVGCGGEDNLAPPSSNEPAITWHQDIQPVFEAHCNSCHREGGIAPFSFASLEDVRGVSGLIPPTIQSREMPPFLAAPAVRPLAFDNSLSDTQIDAIVTWVEDGLPEGDPRQPGASLDLPVSELSRRDLEIGMLDSYAPSTTPDDYRCFVLSWPEAEPVYITGYEIVPGNLAIDHHAALFLIDPDLSAVVDGADAVDGKGQGYSCFGSAAPPGHEGMPTKLLGAWTPGSGGLDFPEGTGIRVEPGSRVVLQMHYSTTTDEPPSDLTRVHFKLDAEIEDNGGFLPWLDIGWPSNPQSMRIPAGEANVVHEYVGDPTASPLYGEFVAGVDPDEGIFVHGVLPHMHKLGSSFWLQLERADGTEERIIEIRRWDFDWQSRYTFAQPVRLPKGAVVHAELHYDNSSNNPVNPNAPPKRVRWGRETNDEMGSVTLLVVPRHAADLRKLRRSIREQARPRRRGRARRVR
jgi:hypothetical protein